ncbi:MAG: peptidyl-prolyl cis-trans isomerase [Candidatus Krumholzibacteriia bacterium]
MTPHDSLIARLKPVAAAALACSLLAGTLLLSGCGQDAADDDLVLAVVGGNEITAGYYKDRLAKMEEHELPRDESGQPLDMASHEGKQAFLEVLINKELMQLKAVDLGYDQEPHVQSALAQLRESRAADLLQQDLAKDIPREASPQEVEAFASRLGEGRRFEYLVTNFREEAEAARQRALEGADWIDLVREFHGGPAPQDSVLELTAVWGQYEPSFEGPLFAVAEGEVTEPVKTGTGFWLMRPVEIRQTDQQLDDARVKQQIHDSIYRRKVGTIRRQFQEEERAERNFTLDEDVLWIVYQGLPAGEQIFKPGTREPYSREELEPLQVDSAELERVLYTYDGPDGPVTVTLGDYKERFDGMNVFERPKRSDMLGGLRNRLLAEVDQQILRQEARERGYHDDPRVVEYLQNRLNEVIVTRLHGDLVKLDDPVSDADLKTFWRDHMSEYHEPAGRAGRAIVCEDRAAAEQARQQLQEGREFGEVLAEFGDPRNQSADGVFEPVRSPDVSPLHRAVFDTPVGGLTPVVPIEGNFVVVLVDSMVAPIEPTLEEKRQEIVARIESTRRDEILRELLAQWRREFGVEIRDDALAALPSWEELAEKAAPAAPVS